jgi:hypothetical protein
VIVDVAREQTGEQKDRKNFRPEADHEGDGKSRWRIPSADIRPKLEVDGGAIEENVEEDAEKGEEEPAKMERRGTCSTLKHLARSVLQRGREAVVPFRAFGCNEVLASHKPSVNC